MNERYPNDANHRDRNEQDRCLVGAWFELFGSLVNEKGDGLGLPNDVAGYDLHRAELPDRPSQAEHNAIRERPLDRRKRDAPEALGGVGAERSRRQLLV